MVRREPVGQKYLSASFKKIRFLEGAEVANREVCHDIGEVPEGSNGEETVEADQEINVRRVAAPSQAAVVSVLCLRSSLFIVQVSSWNLSFKMFAPVKVDHFTTICYTPFFNHLCHLFVLEPSL